MEQHRVLVIIVSVAVVLAAVVGIGLWLYYPREGETAEMAMEDSPGSGGFEWQPLDYLQGQGDAPGLETDGESPDQDTEEPAEFEVTYGVVDGDDPAQDTPSPVITAEPAAPSDDREGEVTTVTPSSTGSSGGVAVSEVPSASQVARATAEQAPNETGITPSRDPAPASPDLADRAYWVQAISSPNRDTVEQARLTLRDHQLGSRILTREINGRTYFRLRVGPFAVRAEAEKFLGWVRDIEDFSDAMIFVDYTTPVLAARPD